MKIQAITSRIGLATVACISFGCMPTPMPAAITGAVPGADGLVSGYEAAQIMGSVLLPQSLVSSDTVIPTGIGSVIAVGGGDVIPTGQGAYRVAALSEADRELPVVGAQVMLRDPVTREPLPQIAPTRTDAKGQFAFGPGGLPIGSNMLVDVTFSGKDGRRYRLLAMARTFPTQAPTAVSWRSTAVVASQLAQRSVDPLTLDPAQLAAQEQSLATAFSTMPEAERKRLLEQAVVRPVEEKTGATLNLPAPVLPSLPPLPLPSPPASVPNVVTSTVPAIVTSTVPALVTETVPSILTSTVPAVLSSTVPAVLTSTVPAVLSSTVPTVLTSTVPAVVGSTLTGTTGAVSGALGSLTSGLGLTATPAPTPTPAPTATPTPKPTATPKPTGLVGGLLGGLL